MRALEHGRIRLALHELKAGEGPALLALHSLRGSSEEWGDSLAAWSGSVFALDFSGHGASARVRGGAYSPELLAGDADVASAAVGARYLIGRGLGAWVALLVAGSRPDEIAGVLLLPGPGLEGGGPAPRFEGASERFAADLAADEAHQARAELAASAGGEARAAEPDPALRFLTTDVRPPGYAASFAARARRVLIVEDGGPRPPWWTALRGLAAVEPVADALPAALERLARPRGMPPPPRSSP